MPHFPLFDTAIDNRGLFSDYYLTERFPQRDDVQALHDEADAAFASVCALYKEHAAYVSTWNEATTEDDFIQPVLDRLGWARSVQQHVQRQGVQGRPDYALFRSDARKREARTAASGDTSTLVQYADMVADAKYWGRPLDGPAPDPDREDRAAMRQDNPSFQILDYILLTGVSWGLLTNGSHWRLYYEKAPSRIETYLEINLDHLCRQAQGTASDREEARDAFRLFYALFRADAHRQTAHGPTFLEDVYAASDRYAEELEDQLNERIFDQVFLELATGLYENHVRTHDPSDPDAPLDDVYRATLRLLYRLLFLLYAEARDLLPLDNDGYRRHSLTRLAASAQEDGAAGHPLSTRHADLWNDLQALVRTIDQGDPAFDVPAYNGGLFDTDNPANAFLDSHSIGERYMVRALVHLTALDPDDHPTGAQVDYKALDVRQLGSIYEGLLEHRLVRTDNGTLDLQTDKGERKKTGSYYTPHYIVEYIVEHTLGPIVERRTTQFEDAMQRIQSILADAQDPDAPGVRAKLDAPRQAAREALLTVRVCDPAMGSGHFLVYAADYLAESFAQILSRYPKHNPVTETLATIRQNILASLEQQGIDTGAIQTDNRLRDTSLLKRLVMKRCIYGVDLNPMAVELAKVSLWLHSFTVGAPLSFLDHHLKAGNSLIGAEVDAVMDAITGDLFGNIRGEILRGTQFLQDAAFNTDATLADVADSAAAFRAYQDKMAPYKRLLDLWTAQHFDAPKGRTLVQDYAREVINAYQEGGGTVLSEYPDTVDTAERIARTKRVFHWELEFPEVYYDLETSKRRPNPGFDAVVGNPPYVRIQTMSESDEAAVSYFGQSYETPSGNYDIYALFAEKGGTLLSDDGILGYIVPHKFFTANYGEGLRRWISGKSTLRHVVDFGSEQVFDNVTTYTCLLFLEGVARDAFTYIQPSTPEAIAGDAEFQSFVLENDALDEKPWSLGNPKLLALRARLDEDHPTLEEVTSRIFQGLKTSADAIYIVDELERRDGEVRIHSPQLEKKFWVESDLFYRLIKGGDVQSYHIANTNRLILFPYGPGESGEMGLIPAEQMEAKYPLTWAYLQENRDYLRDRESGGFKDENWHRFGRSQALNEISRPKIATPDFAASASYAFDESGDHYFTGGAAGGYGILIERSFSEWYAIALLNSRLLDQILKTVSTTFRGGWYSFEARFIKHLPIHEIPFTTPEDERTAHVQELIDTYEQTRSANADPTANDVLHRVEAHLAGDPERADVIHDLLAHLAREMTRLKEERATFNLDLTDYVAEPTERTGVRLTELEARYQPAPGVQTSLLADTTTERDGLRIGTLSAEREGDTVRVHATARYKPDAEESIPDDALDQWGYHETDPVAVCTLHDSPDAEAGLVVHWMDVLNAHGSGYGGYRANATKTNSLLDRIHAARLPDPSDDAIQRSLRPFLDNATEAARLDAHLTFTDTLIDQIVYRLYGLTDGEVAVVEGV